MEGSLVPSASMLSFGSSCSLLVLLPSGGLSPYFEDILLRAFTDLRIESLQEVIALSDTIITRTFFRFETYLLSKAHNPEGQRRTN